MDSNGGVAANRFTMPMCMLFLVATNMAYTNWMPLNGTHWRPATSQKKTGSTHALVGTFSHTPPGA